MQKTGRRKKPLIEEDRIQLTSSKYLFNVKLTLIILSCTVVVGIVALFLQLGLTFISLGAAAGILVIAFLLIRSIRKNTRCTALKDDNLILNSFGNKNYVAPIRSIRTVKSTPILGLQYTRIIYKLDGKENSFFILSKKFMAQSPEQFLKNTIERINEEKKKANHKPGSVFTQSA